MAWQQVCMHIQYACIMLTFRSVFIERFHRSTVARFMYCAGMVAECNDSVGYRVIRHG